MKKTVVVIAGGGTGGHIYPGLAIARALQSIDANLEIHFVGTANGLESKIVPKEGFPLHLIAGGKLNFSGQVFEKVKTLIRLPVGFFQSVFLLFKLKPKIVLGVGGFASGPFVLAASMLGFSTAIWEPNALPGMANRWLGKFVDQCFLVFDETKNYLSCKKMEVLGMPVRAEMETGETKPHGKDEFHLLHYGGSQGSRAIGRALFEALRSEKYELGLKVVHQTGSIDHQDFLERYKDMRDLVEVKEFIYDMPNYYAWADLVVCRGGAGTLNELAAFGIPAIVIPLPAADGHQEKNAQVLVQAGAARMILQKDLTPSRLMNEINELRHNKSTREEMKQKIRQFYRPQASQKIAHKLIESMSR